MFKLQRLNKQPSASRERVEFRFSGFQLIQVPKGWDRLQVTIISTETGNAIAKLGKAPMRNGGCQWTESILESLKIPQDLSRESTECYLKFIFSTGSAKLGILGEVTLNMARYVNPGMSASVSFPLKKCNYETIMQVKIQCLTPRTRLRLEELKYSQPQGEEIDTEYHEAHSISNASEDSFEGSVRSSASQTLGSKSRRGKLDRKATSSSVSSSNRSFDEDSTGRGNGVLSDDECSVSTKSSSRLKTMGPRENWQSNGDEFALSARKSAGSSKNQLETAEDTIEELRAEAKMWERNARKLMLDLDLLSKEFSDQSKKQADLVMELSAAYAEHEGFQKEIETLKLALEQTKVKEESNEDLALQSEGKTRLQKELEYEIRYQQESNVNLALQLKRSQESNIELVSVLQELEETIEQQRAEIENLSALQSELNDKGSNKEGYIMENEDLSCKLQQLQESEKALQFSVQLLEKALEEKTKELEDERSQTIQSLLNIEKEYKYQLSLKEENKARLEAKLSEAQTGVHDTVTRHNKDNCVVLEKEIEALKEKFQELERDCNELTDENLDLILKLKESNGHHVSGCMSSESFSTEPQFTLVNAESGMKEDEAFNYGIENKGCGTSDEKSNPLRGSDYFTELLGPLEMLSRNVKKPWYSVNPDVSEKVGCDLVSLINVSEIDDYTSHLWVESMQSYLFELNKLLETKIAQCEEKLKHSDLEIQEKKCIIEESQMKLQNYLLTIREFDCLKTELEDDYRNLQKELSERISQVGHLKSNLVTKDQECDSLIQHEKELQKEVSDLQEKKRQLEEKLELVLKESEHTSKTLNDLQNELAALGSSLDSNVTAKVVLEEQLIKLGNRNCELENQLSGLNEENFYLKEQLSALQSQLQNLAAVNHTCQLELESSKNSAMTLESDIRTLEFEMDAQRIDLERKIKDIESKYEVCLCECDLLQAENRKLELSAKALMEGHTTLKKSNAELMETKLELLQYCSQMEARLNQCQGLFLESSRKVEDLEKNLSSLQETISHGERSLNTELEALLEAHRKDMERLGTEGSPSEQMSEEKSLQQKVDQLNKKMSMVNEEKERIAFEAADALSTVLKDKARLEQDLHAADEKAKKAERELDNLRAEYELKIQGLVIELDSAKQSSEMLTNEHERMLKLLANYRTCEEKVKIAVNDLELKLTISDYERKLLIEQVTDMKVQLQKSTELQSQVTLLNKELRDCRSEKGKLEAMLQTAVQDHEELKAEKLSFVEKISSLEQAMNESENCRQQRIALEQKILQLEADLASKASQSAHNADLKKELCGIQIANQQYQQKIHELEQEKFDFSERAQSLRQLMDEQQSPFQKDDSVDSSNNASPCSTTEKNHGMKMMLLENEFADSLDANKCKTQLQRFWSEGRTHVVTTKKSVVEGDVVTEERYERSKSSLETELKELQERYFQMSLKYAEVEAQREDLVMQLKAAKSAKRWFS